jgi:uncharacterized protein (TIGR02466 family)
MSSGFNIKVFPTLINYTNNFLNKKECEEIINLILNEKLNSHLCLIGKAKTTHTLSNNILNNSKNTILEKINNKINEYAVDYGVRKLKLDNSWINIQNKNSVLSKHSHPDSIVSGALYLKVDKNSSKIYFYNPNPYLNFVNIYKQTEFTYENYFFTPQIGDLILFPSWLMHGSNNEKNNTTKRIVLSFNTVYLC